MFVHPPTRSLLLDAPDPAAIMTIVPARSMQGAGFNVAVKHTEAATLALREVGFKAPSPIISYYDWPGKFKPFEHQRAMSEFMTLHRRVFNLSEMGIGKTGSTLWAADWLMRQGTIRKALIVAPLSTLQPIWQRAVSEFVMHRQSVIVHGSRDQRKIALAMDVDFYIINNDGLSIGEIRAVINAKPDINLVIVDEGSKFKNADTDRYRSLERIVGLPTKPVHGRWLWWLTGTPCSNGPSDAWAQARLINPATPKFYGAFRRLTMYEVSEHTWKPRPDGYKHAYEIMQPAIRFAKNDCLDLPALTTEDWVCELSAEQKKALKEMMTTMKLEAASARQNGVAITAVNAADRINKCRQICIGSIKADVDTYINLDFEPRLKLLKDAIEFASAKVYVIVPFKGAIQALETRLKQAHYSVAMINGDVSLANRNRIISDYMTTPNPRVLLCHPAVASHGLNFTIADTLIFFGPIYSNDEVQQIIERFNRPGQTRKMTIIRIGATPLEWKIYNMPVEKQATQMSILNLYNSIVETA